MGDCGAQMLEIHPVPELVLFRVLLRVFRVFRGCLD
jgi:hypothetical protein